MEQLLKGSGFVLILVSVFFLGSILKLYERQLLLQEKATLVQELTGVEAKTRFLYQVCRDKEWDENGDRSACYDIFR